MGVAGEIGENGLWPGERPLGVDHPFAATQRCEGGVEGAPLGKRGEVAEEGEPAGGMQGFEAFEEEAAEQAREHAHRQKEASLAGDPARSVGRQAAAGDDDVDVGMVGERRAQVCSTAVRPMRAPRCFGSAAMAISVSAAVLNKRS